MGETDTKPENTFRFILKCFKYLFIGLPKKFVTEISLALPIYYGISANFLGNSLSFFISFKFALKFTLPTCSALN